MVDESAVFVRHTYTRAQYTYHTRFFLLACCCLCICCNMMMTTTTDNVCIYSIGFSVFCCRCRCHCRVWASGRKYTHKFIHIHRIVILYTINALGCIVCQIIIKTFGVEKIVQIFREKAISKAAIFVHDSWNTSMICTKKNSIIIEYFLHIKNGSESEEKNENMDEKIPLDTPKIWTVL